MIITKTIGIDLGTTNSVVAVMDMDNQNVITHTDKMGRHIIPSVVGIQPKTGNVITGYLAYSYRGTRNAPVVSVKRKMGSTEKIQLGENEYMPEDISSMIIAECIRCMQEQLDKLDDGNEYKIGKALVTVPAYFDINATEATRRAGEKAGIDVDVLQEPTAAAMYYIWKNKLPDGSYLVFDLGGGTFDVSIVNMSMGVASVLGLSGNNYLGGDDFDRRLARKLLQMLQDSGEYTLDLDDNDPEDRLRYAKLVLKAEELKKELSGKGEVYFESSNIFEDQDGRSVRVDVMFSREEFEELIADLVDSALQECEKAIAEAIAAKRISGIEDIQQVLMVGGSTKVPLVQEKVRAHFCDPNKAHVQNLTILLDEPDFAVGYGAALCASSQGNVYAGEDGVQLTAKQDYLDLDGIGSLAVMGSVDGVADASLYKLQVRSAEGDVVGSGRVGKDGSFTVDVDVGEDEETMTVELLDASGGVAVTQTLAIDRRPPVPPPPAVLPMDINLDVWNADEERVVKRALINKLTPLPAQAGHTLYANEGTTDHFVIRLYQGYDELKVVAIQPKRRLEPGEPVRLDVRCDESFTISITGDAGGEAIEVVVSAPPREHKPDDMRIQQQKLRQEFERYIQIYQGGQLAEYSAEERKYTNAIEDGFEDNELPKVSESLMLYQALVERMRPVKMDPPKEEFDKIIGQGMMMVMAISQMPKDKVPPTYRQDEAVASIEAIREAATDAYNRQDRKQVKEYHDKLMELCGYLYSIIQGGGDGPTINPVDRLNRIIDQTCQEIEGFMAQNNPAPNDRDRMSAAVAKMRRIKSGLSELMSETQVMEQQREVAAIYQDIKPLLVVGGEGPEILSE